MKTILRINMRLFLLSATLLCCVSCTGKRTQEDVPDLYLKRFDVDFYHYLMNASDDAFWDNYSDFLKVYGENVLNIGSPEDTDFPAKLKEYFSNPAIMDLYQTEQEMFANISALNSEFSGALNYFLEEFPEIPRPEVYMHVSGWEQKVVVTDHILSLSADFYLGSDYPYYQHFFYDYQRANMTQSRMAPDLLLGFMMANLPFEGREDVLLDRMLYEGKLIYILSCLLPEREVWDYVAYTKEEYDWCESNRTQIWKTILENQHLFTPDLRVVSQYIKEAPYTAFLPTQSPGRVGIWLGYQIISSYMKQNPEISFSGLMQKVDYQEILKDSKFR